MIIIVSFYFVYAYTYARSLLLHQELTCTYQFKVCCGKVGIDSFRSIYNNYNIGVTACVGIMYW